MKKLCASERGRIIDYCLCRWERYSHSIGHRDFAYAWDACSLCNSEKLNAIFICVRHSFSAPKNDNYLNDYLWSFLCNECMNTAHTQTRTLCAIQTTKDTKNHIEHRWKIALFVIAIQFDDVCAFCICFTFFSSYFSPSLFFFLFQPIALSLSLLFRNCSILALGALFILFLFWKVLLLLSIKCKQYLVVWHWFQLWTIFFVCSSLFSSLHGNMLDFLCVSFMCCSRKTNQTHILLSLRIEHVNRSNFYGKKSNRCLGKFCSYWSFCLMRYTKQTEIELDETQIRSSSFHSTDLRFKHSFFSLKLCAQLDWFTNTQILTGWILFWAGLHSKNAATIIFLISLQVVH